MNHQRTVSVILAFVVVTATFSVLRLDLTGKYIPVSERLIAFSADIEQSVTSIQERNNSPTENVPFHVPPPFNPSVPADADANAIIFDQQPTKGTSLWIYVQQFSEGMATWRMSFAEILMVAKKLNATVVEPCVRRGRLRTCDDSSYRLDQVYDMSLLRQFHPHIVSFDDYRTMMLAVQNPVIVSMCLQDPKGYPPPAELCGNITNWYKRG